MGLYWSLTLYRLLPEFRRLEAELQEHLKEEFLEVLARPREGFLKAYSTVGLCGRGELLLWRGSPAPEGLLLLARELNRTRMLGYLLPVRVYLDQGEGVPGEGGLLLLEGEATPPPGVRVHRGRRLFLLEGPLEALFPLALEGEGVLGLGLGLREVLDEL